MAEPADKNLWLPWDEPEGGGIYTRDHLDPSFAYMGYKFQVTELVELVNSIHLAWDFSFGVASRDYIKFVGDHLLETGAITPDSSRADVHYEFNRTTPSQTRHALHAQVLASVVSAYLRYIKTLLSFILPAHHQEYPKRFKIDLNVTLDAADLDDLVVRSLLSEIDAIGFYDYPTLKQKCHALGIYPSSRNRDLVLVEKYIKRRNEILHFHPGAAFVQSGYLRDSTKMTERSMWASIYAFSRVVKSIERAAMKKYRVWSGYRMLERHASSSGKWPVDHLARVKSADGR